MDSKTNYSTFNWIIAIIGFIIGLLVGFLGRPFFVPNQPVEIVTVETSPPQPYPAQEREQETTPRPSPTQEREQETTPQPSPSQEREQEPTLEKPLPTPSIMDLVLANSRHMLGDETAPVTLIEFGDFK
ncbi:MAG: hypothetical protein B6242_07440 [Anaerolineaceae bacterium 4572_78]|nr:MAG: hypothetical protein B6242_07440 [Anaerolineaceae bacterium 4572_78]